MMYSTLAVHMCLTLLLVVVVVVAAALLLCGESDRLAEYGWQPHRDVSAQQTKHRRPLLIYA